MSSTFYTATATCEASLNFSLNDYLETLSKKVSANLDEQEEVIRNYVEYYGIEDFVDEMKKYITCEQYSRVNEISIKMDSEESNGDSCTFDFLVNCIRRDVMCNKVMEIYTCSYDTRAGQSSYHYFITKGGREIGPDRMIELIESSNFVD